MLPNDNQRESAKKILVDLAKVNSSYHGTEKTNMGVDLPKLRNATTPYQLLYSILENVSLGNKPPKASDMINIILECSRDPKNSVDYKRIDLSSSMADLVSQFCVDTNVSRSR